MPDVLVRDLDAAVIDGLKKQAKDSNRSLQSEMKTILSAASKRVSKLSRAETARKIREAIARSGRLQTDSAILLREDRHDPDR